MTVVHQTLCDTMVVNFGDGLFAGPVDGANHHVGGGIETARKIILQGLYSAVPMGLEDRDDATVLECVGRGLQGGTDFGRVVTVIVDDGDGLYREIAGEWQSGEGGLEGDHRTSVGGSAAYTMTIRPLSRPLIWKLWLSWSIIGRCMQMFRNCVTLRKR